MKQTLTLTVALAAGLAAAAHAQATGRTAAGTRSLVTAADRTAGEGRTITLAQNAPAPGAVVQAQAVPRIPEGTPVVVVGEITSPPKAIVSENKAQVAIGPTRMDYTLHLSDATLYDQHGAVLKPTRLSDKAWVRAEGTVMNDPRRIKVTQLQVIGKDPSRLQQSAFFRPGYERGYIMAVAGTRQIFPEATGVVFTPPAMSIVGQVADDTGPLEATRKIQVKAAGNTWTLEVPKDTPVFDVQGKKISVHNVAKGQWIRAHGWQTDDLRIRAARLQEIGPQEAFRTSTFFRAREPMGYVERAPGPEVRFNPIQVTGTITAIDQTAGTVTIRDDAGRERVFPLATLTIRANGRQIDAATVQQGQQVAVEGSEIVFQP